MSTSINYYNINNKCLLVLGTQYLLKFKMQLLIECSPKSLSGAT